MDLEGEKLSGKKCNTQSDIMVYFLVVVDTNRGWVDAFNITTSTHIQNVFYQTYESFSTVELLLQAVGLISLFINMNINQTVPALFKLAFKGYLRTTIFRRVYPKMKLLLLILSFFVVFETAFSMYCTYRDNIKMPLETKISNYSLSPTPFGLVFCIPVKILLLNANLSNEISKMSDDQILSSYSYDEIERYTQVDLHEYVAEIYLSYGNRKFPWIFEASEKIFFKNCSYESSFDPVVYYNFSRCFEININLVEHRYQSLLAISNLVIMLKTKQEFDGSKEPLFTVIYLLEEREIFNGLFLLIFCPTPFGSESASPFTNGSS